MPEPDDELDGCEIDMTDPAHVTADGEEVTALLLFADCWDDPAAVEQRVGELEELAAAGLVPPPTPVGPELDLDAAVSDPAGTVWKDRS